jgi:hypothetical protein
MSEKDFRGFWEQSQLKAGINNVPGGRAETVLPRPEEGPMAVNSCRRGDRKQGDRGQQVLGEFHVFVP